MNGKKTTLKKSSLIRANDKINEIKGKITNITNLATTPALIAVENKIPNNFSNLILKNWL